MTSTRLTRDQANRWRPKHCAMAALHDAAKPVEPRHGQRSVYVLAVSRLRVNGATPRGAGASVCSWCPAMRPIKLAICGGTRR